MLFFLKFVTRNKYPPLRGENSLREFVHSSSAIKKSRSKVSISSAFFAQHKAPEEHPYIDSNFSLSAFRRDEFDSWPIDRISGVVKLHHAGNVIPVDR